MLAVKVFLICFDKCVGMVGLYILRGTEGAVLLAAAQKNQKAAGGVATPPRPP